MSNNISVLKDISYGVHERQKVDIFIPPKTESDSGILLFIHGGGWVEGDKSGHHCDAEYFCNLGYICSVMNYRYVSEEEKIDVFDELDDIASALNVIKEKCKEYGFNTEKAILSGGSAGAHLSLLYAYTRKNESPVTPVAVCAYCPPVNCSKSDFLLGISGEFEDWKYEVLSKCCGVKITKSTFLNIPQQTALKRISPEEYIINSDCVPTAVFHGDSDELIPLEHIHNFLNLLDKSKIKNNLLIYKNSGHALDKDPEGPIAAKNIIKNYIDLYL